MLGGWIGIPQSVTKHSFNVAIMAGILLWAAYIKIMINHGGTEVW